MRNATEKDTSIFILLIIVLKIYLLLYRGQVPHPTESYPQLWGLEQLSS